MPTEPGARPPSAHLGNEASAPLPDRSRWLIDGELHEGLDSCCGQSDGCRSGTGERDSRIIRDDEASSSRPLARSETSCTSARSIALREYALQWLCPPIGADAPHAAD